MTLQVVTSAETLAAQELEARTRREKVWPEAARFLREAMNLPPGPRAEQEFRAKWEPWLAGRTNTPLEPSPARVA